jgi:hypothetical protein
MRSFIVCSLLFVASIPVWAQPTRADSLRSLSFLQGIWTLQNGEGTETTEFHWSAIGGNRVLVGRSWSGMAGSCPWCVTQTAMVAKYDPSRSEVRIHFVDRGQQVLDFRLAVAGKESVQFLTEMGLGLPTYRLTYALAETGSLIQTIEKQSDRGGVFVPVFQASFRRR